MIVAGCGGRRLALRFSKSHPVFRSGCLTLQDSRGWQNCPEGMSPGRMLGVWEGKTASCWGCDSGMDGGREEVLLSENEKFQRLGCKPTISPPATYHSSIRTRATGGRVASCMDPPPLRLSGMRKCPLTIDVHGHI